jgi:hypothetical protein
LFGDRHLVKGLPRNEQKSNKLHPRFLHSVLERHSNAARIALIVYEARCTLQSRQPKSDHLSLPP